jgi:hypothetical protein
MRTEVNRFSSLGAGVGAESVMGRRARRGSRVGSSILIVVKIE